MDITKGKPVKVHCNFSQVKVGSSFECNGNIVVKRSTRTGFIESVGRWFYYAQRETVTVESLEDIQAAPAPLGEPAPILFNPAASVPIPAPREYYLKRGKFGLWDLRQTRYKSQFDAGNEHSHDLCAVGFQAKAMRDLINMYKFDCDLSPLDKEDSE